MAKNKKATLALDVKPKHIKKGVPSLEECPLALAIVEQYKPDEVEVDGSSAILTYVLGDLSTAAGLRKSVATLDKLGIPDNAYISQDDDYGRIIKEYDLPEEAQQFIRTFDNDYSAIENGRNEGFKKPRVAPALFTLTEA